MRKNIYAAILVLFTPMISLSELPIQMPDLSSSISELFQKESVAIDHSAERSVIDVKVVCFAAFVESIKGEPYSVTEYALVKGRVKIRESKKNGFFVALLARNPYPSFGSKDEWNWAAVGDSIDGHTNYSYEISTVAPEKNSVLGVLECYSHGEDYSESVSKKLIFVVADFQDFEFARGDSIEKNELEKVFPSIASDNLVRYHFVD